MTTQRKLTGIKIAGNIYDVLTDESGKVVATACHGRWPMCDAATGDSWLDGQLQQAVDQLIED